MSKEKEPMSMEEYADKITDMLFKGYDYAYIEKADWSDDKVLWSIVFDAICLFQKLQDEKELNAKERYQEIKLEKEREGGK